MEYQLNHCQIQLSSQNHFVILTILRGTWIALNSIAIKIRNINNKFCNQGSKTTNSFNCLGYSDD